MSSNAAGILVLISSVFTLIHAHLACDQCPAEYGKLQTFRQGLHIEDANLWAKGN
jgi:hypothetical protein